MNPLPQSAQVEFSTVVNPSPQSLHRAEFSTVVNPLPQASHSSQFSLADYISVLNDDGAVGFGSTKYKRTWSIKELLV